MKQNLIDSTVLGKDSLPHHFLQPDITTHGVEACIDRKLASTSKTSLVLEEALANKKSCYGRVEGPTEAAMRERSD